MIHPPRHRVLLCVLAGLSFGACPAGHALSDEGASLLQRLKARVATERNGDPAANQRTPEGARMRLGGQTTGRVLFADEPSPTMGDRSDPAELEQPAPPLPMPPDPRRTPNGRDRAHDTEQGFPSPSRWTGVRGQVTEPPRAAGAPAVATPRGAAARTPTPTAGVRTEPTPAPARHLPPDRGPVVPPAAPAPGGSRRTFAELSDEELIAWATANVWAPERGRQHRPPPSLPPGVHPKEPAAGASKAKASAKPATPAKPAKGAKGSERAGPPPKPQGGKTAPPKSPRKSESGKAATGSATKAPKSAAKTPKPTGSGRATTRAGAGS